MYLPTSAISRMGLGALMRSTRARHDVEVGLDVRVDETQVADDQPAEAGLLEHERHFVDGVRGLGRDDRLARDVGEQRDLVADLVADRMIGAQHDHVGLDTDATQLLDRVLGRLGLELTGGREGGQQRDVDVQHVGPADVLAHLADGFEERQRFDVADGAADLDDHDVRVAVARDPRDALLDLVRDVGDDLDRPAEVVAATLLGDDRLVDAPGRDVAQLGQVRVDEAFVVAQVQVGLGAVVGDEDLAVLVRGHRPGVDVDVGVQLEDGDPQAPCLEDPPDAGGSDAFAETARDAAGHEDILRHRSRFLRGFSDATGPCLRKQIHPTDSRPAVLPRTGVVVRTCPQGCTRTGQGVDSGHPQRAHRMTQRREGRACQASWTSG